MVRRRNDEGDDGAAIDHFRRALALASAGNFTSEQIIALIGLAVASGSAHDARLACDLAATSGHRILYARALTVLGCLDGNSAQAEEALSIFRQCGCAPRRASGAVRPAIPGVRTRHAAPTAGVTGG